MTIPAGAFPLAENEVRLALQNRIPGPLMIGALTAPYVDSTYVVRWPILTSADRDNLLAEFNAAKGAVDNTTWTHPVDGALTVRFVQGTLSFRRRSVSTWSASVRFALEGPLGA